MESLGPCRTHSPLLPASISSKLTSRLDSSLETHCLTLATSIQKWDPCHFLFQSQRSLLVHVSHHFSSPGEIFRFQIICRDAEWLDQACLNWSYQLHPFPQALMCYLHNRIQRNIYWDITRSRHYIRYKIATTTATVVTHIIPIMKAGIITIQFACRLIYILYKSKVIQSLYHDSSTVEL